MQWIHNPKRNPLDWYAFVYRITLPDGRYYIGKCNLWLRRHGKISGPSRWRTYWGSSKTLTALVAEVGKEKCKREILHFCVSAGEASYRELELLVKLDALIDPQCLNSNILMRFHRKSVAGYHSKERRARYLADISKRKAELRIG